MTNRQWLLWQMIDMPDDILLRAFAGWSCDVCQMYVRPSDGPCHERYVQKRKAKKVAKKHGK